jgi:hypothetical protein
LVGHKGGGLSKPYIKLLVEKKYAQWKRMKASRWDAVRFGL